MVAFEFRVTGLDRLDRKFAEWPEKLRNKAERTAARKAAKPLQQQAIQEAPKDKGVLRKSIKIRAIKRRRGQKTIGVRVVAGEGFFAGDTFYAGFIEFGRGVGKRTATSRRRKRELTNLSDSRQRVPPNPFMKRAMDKTRAAVEALYSYEILRIVHEMAAEN